MSGDGGDGGEEGDLRISPLDVVQCSLWKLHQLSIPHSVNSGGPGLLGEGLHLRRRGRGGGHQDTSSISCCCRASSTFKSISNTWTTDPLMDLHRLHYNQWPQGGGAKS